jgi:hypothetical protein
MGKPKQQILVEKELGARPASPPTLPTSKRKRGRPKKAIPMAETHRHQAPRVSREGKDAALEDTVDQMLSQAEASSAPTGRDAIIQHFNFVASHEGLTVEQYALLADGIARGATLAQAQLYCEEVWGLHGMSQKVLQGNDKIKKALAEKNLHQMVYARDSVATYVPIVVNNTVEIINRTKRELDYVSEQLRVMSPRDPVYGQLSRQLKENNIVLQSYLKIYSDLLEWTEKGIKIASEDADQDMLKRKLEGFLDEHVLEEDEGNAESPADTDTYESEPEDVSINDPE